MSYLPITNIDKWKMEKYGLDLSCVYNKEQEYFFLGVFPEHYKFINHQLEGIRIIWEKNTYTLEEYERNTSSKSK